LAAQNIQQEILWEVIIVDNASTDDTGQCALSIWDRIGKPTTMRVITEPRIGIGYARYKGFEEAKYEFICFIDDDNWVASDYASTGFEFMQRHSEVGACGSLNEVVSDIALPWWFEKYQRSYAVGPQSEEPGDVTENRGVLWSAGLIVRRFALQDLLDAGFRPMVIGARGEKVIMRGEDYEMCLAMRLRGWKLWYEPKLTLKHYMPPERLNWKYLRRLLRGVGASDPTLRPYYLAITRKKDFWRRQIIALFMGMMKSPMKLLLATFCSCEGDHEVLMIERSFGFIWALMRIRKNYDRLFLDFNRSGWVTLHNLTAERHEP